MKKLVMAGSMVMELDKKEACKQFKRDALLYIEKHLGCASHKTVDDMALTDISIVYDNYDIRSGWDFLHCLEDYVSKHNYIMDCTECKCGSN